MKWNTNNKTWYESKGYVFTKYKDEFKVKVEDLPFGSGAIIEVKCDNINCSNLKIVQMPWGRYLKRLRDNKYYCPQCVNKLISRPKASKTIIENNKKEKEYEENVNTQGEKMKVLKYIDTYNVIIQFENGYIRNSSYWGFKRGLVRNPTNLNSDKGYLGEGDCKTSINGNTTKEYSAWKFMMKRCYDKDYKINRPTYDDCSVCEEWHNFQNFAKWYKENYYEVDNKKMHVDKDILVKGNKIYSPDTCCIVPNNINSIFVSSKSSRGLYPRGVTLQDNKFYSYCGDNNGNRTYLGSYQTPELAFEAYKEYKENLIKELAEKYHGLIPENVYNALINYKVEITD